MSPVQEVSSLTFSSQYWSTLGDIKRSAGMQVGQPAQLSNILFMPVLTSAMQIRLYRSFNTPFPTSIREQCSVEY